MEYVDGPTIGQLIRRHGPLPEKFAIRIIAQITRALRHARRRGIIHPDIKPENLMITRNGTAKLCDLDLAIFAEPPGRNSNCEWIRPEVNSTSGHGGHCHYWPHLSPPPTRWRALLTSGALRSSIAQDVSDHRN